MAKAYDYDLRVKALEMIAKGISVYQVSRLLNISRDTLYRWKNLKSEAGDVRAKSTSNGGHGHKVSNLDEFKKFIDSNPDKTQEELGLLWINPMKQRTVSEYIKKIGYTKKKDIHV